MRRVRPDPIPTDVQARILDAAIRAPSGGNAQAWRFVLVDDPDVRARLAPVYRRALTTLWETFYADRLAEARSDPESPEGVGSALTTVLSFLAKEEVLGILGVPTEEGWMNACCVSFGYPTGRWGVPERRPVHDVAARNRWDGPLGFEVPAPLWPPASS